MADGPDRRKSAEAKRRRSEYRKEKHDKKPGVLELSAAGVTSTPTVEVTSPPRKRARGTSWDLPTTPVQGSAGIFKKGTVSGSPQRTPVHPLGRPMTIPTSDFLVKPAPGTPTFRNRRHPSQSREERP